MEREAAKGVRVGVNENQKSRVIGKKEGDKKGPLLCGNRRSARVGRPNRTVLIAAVPRLPVLG
jgi:hypothetical protein